MILQESGEMYLETILQLQQKQGKVRAIDVAEQMNFTKASVSRAMSEYFKTRKLYSGGSRRQYCAYRCRPCQSTGSA